MDLIFTIHLVAPKNTKSLPLIQMILFNLTKKNLLLHFLLFFGSFLVSRYQKEKERLRPKPGVACCSSLLWRQDQVKDRDRNESSIT